MFHGVGWCVGFVGGYRDYLRAGAIDVDVDALFVVLHEAFSENPLCVSVWTMMMGKSDGMNFTQHGVASVCRRWSKG